MKEELRIKKHLEFDEFFKNSACIKSNYLNLYIKEKKNSISRVGIAISNKIGNAVKRNLFKRRLRNIVRINYETLNKKYDYIALIKKNCGTIDYSVMEKEFLELIKKVK